MIPQPEATMTTVLYSFTGIGFPYGPLKNAAYD